VDLSRYEDEMAAPQNGEGFVFLLLGVDTMRERRAGKGTKIRQAETKMQYSDAWVIYRFYIVK
jgi:hypothetical protein